MRAGHICVHVQVRRRRLEGRLLPGRPRLGDSCHGPGIQIAAGGFGHPGPHGLPAVSVGAETRCTASSGPQRDAPVDTCPGGEQRVGGGSGDRGQVSGGGGGGMGGAAPPEAAAGGRRGCSPAAIAAARCDTAIVEQWSRWREIVACPPWQIVAAAAGHKLQRHLTRAAAGGRRGGGGRPATLMARRRGRQASSAGPVSPHGTINAHSFCYRTQLRLAGHAQDEFRTKRLKVRIRLALAALFLVMPPLRCTLAHTGPLYLQCGRFQHRKALIIAFLPNQFKTGRLGSGSLHFRRPGVPRVCRRIFVQQMLPRRCGRVGRRSVTGAAAGQALHACREIGLEEKGDRVALLAGVVDHPVQGAAVQAVRPAAGG